MKKITQIKSICGNEARVRKILGVKSASIIFFKCYGHGTLGGNASQGMLGKIAASGIEVERGHFRNTFYAKL